MDAPAKTIDPARAGLSKSLICTPCERKGAYSEFVRDERGRRLSFPLPEKVTFGSAVDEATSYIVWHDLHGQAWESSDAIERGLAVARAAKGWPLVDDPETFALQVGNAIRLYLMQPDGLARIRTIYDHGLRLQGNDGESLRAGDVIGTPDFLTDRGLGDLKTAGRDDFAARFLRSAEMPIYSLLYAAQAGELPEYLFYQGYVRKQKPEWVWREVPGTAALVELGRSHADHWRKALASGDPDLFGFSTIYCGDCPWRRPIPEVGFAGCPVGAVMPLPVEEAA